MKYKKIPLVIILGLLFLSACSNKEQVGQQEISDRNIQKLKVNMGIIKNYEEEKIIILNAKNWEFDKTTIKVKVGEDITIKINNLDGLHGIAIPAMQLIGDTQIQVDTSKAGEYTFQCLNYCGVGHSKMTGKLIIE